MVTFFLVVIGAMILAGAVFFAMNRTSGTARDGKASQAKVNRQVESGTHEPRGTGIN